MLTKQHFLVIEGIDGSGKTTVIEDIIKPLLADAAVYTRDPGGTLLAEKLRALLVNKLDDEEIHPLSEALLFYASRAQLIHHSINPALRLGKTVVCDRFAWSTWAYQYAGRQSLPASVFTRLDSMLPHPLVKPLVIYLDLDPVHAMHRIQLAQKNSRFDLKYADFFTRVRAQYLALVENTPHCYLVDASQSKQQVAAAIVRIIQGL